ncbi:hypothetical protein, partial [Nocardia cyriacigeorgica]
MDSTLAPETHGGHRPEPEPRSGTSSQAQPASEAARAPQPPESAAAAPAAAQGGLRAQQLRLTAEQQQRRSEAGQ